MKLMVLGHVNIARQGFSFFIVGCCLVVADWLTFVLLTALGMPAAPANVLGRVVGAMLGFWANGWITFGKLGEPRHGYRRFAKFTVAWIVLTLLSTLLVAFLANHLSLRIAWVAKPLVEACLAAASFFISRHWVYR